jgi:hypothetical protein
MRQMYLKLDDVTIRPTYKTNGIDRNTIHFVKFKNKLMSWANETTDEFDDFGDIIVKLLDQTEKYGSDGYSLCKFLENELYISEGDSELVSILDECTWVLSNMTSEKVKQWVIECNLELPSELEGKYVMYTIIENGIKTLKQGYVTGIYNDTYEVVISDSTNAKYIGDVINGEDINCFFSYRPDQKK